MSEKSLAVERLITRTALACGMRLPASSLARRSIVKRERPSRVHRPIKRTLKPAHQSSAPLM